MPLSKDDWRDPVAVLVRQERRAQWLMADSADIVVTLATAIRDQPARTTVRDMGRLASALVALGERFAQWRTLRIELRRLRSLQRPAR